MADAIRNAQSPEALRAVKALGEHVRNARKRHRLTQAQLAERAGVGRLTILKLENGKPGLALATFFEVLMVLDRSMVDGVLKVVADDPLGMAMERSRLPARVVPTDDF